MAKKKNNVYENRQITYVCLEILCALYEFPKNETIQELARKIEPKVMKVMNDVPQEKPKKEVVEEKHDVPELKIEDYLN